MFRCRGGQAAIGRGSAKIQVVLLPRYDFPLQSKNVRLQYLLRTRLASTRQSASFVLTILILAIAFTLSSAQNTKPTVGAGQASTTTPTFTPDDALNILDTLQIALQSYDRKKFLAEFDSARMPNFPAFRDQIKSLFARYDSFTVTYQLAQTGIEGSRGVALADFGLDATPNSEGVPDLRRHTQLRLVVAWNGKEWKIMDLSPRAIF